MTRFAAKTEVPVEKTRAEIESVVRRYGADSFLSGWEDREAMVQFRSAGRYVRFNMTLPEPRDKAFTHFKRGPKTSLLGVRSLGGAREQWEQACRQRWRALLLLVKAKLEAVESGIVTFEQEFLGHVVVEGGTVYDRVRPQLAIAYETSAPANLLLTGSPRGSPK